MMIVLVLAFGVGYYIWLQQNIAENETLASSDIRVIRYKKDGNMVSGRGEACTAEAKRCSDGSYVSRKSPTCEFAPCPGEKTSRGDSKTPSGR